LEILIVDDASTDDTVKVANSFHDRRIRVQVNNSNLGLVRNWNRCLTLSKGELIKFLFQDDLLYPTCVEKMAQLFEKHPRVGMVFSSRNVLLENPADPDAVAWKERFGTLHTRFTSLRKVNRGSRLFNQWFAHQFAENWVGEPSCVMFRKACVNRIGVFNTRMYQMADIEMWARLAYFYDVGFIEEPLSAFTFHTGSATSVNIKRRLAYLDRLWLIEGLLSHKEIRRSHPQLKWLRFLEATHGLKRQVGGRHEQVSTSVPDRQRALAEYLGYLFLELLHVAPSIHG
jgi:glycosyltransferase involved in cell wall biosynthesis